MKTLIAVLTAASVLTLGAQRASAHDGWATTGKILTGLVIGGAVARALEPPPTVVYAPAPVVYSTPAPVVYSTPAPVVAAAPVVTAAPVVAAAPVMAPTPVYVQPAPVVVYSPPPYYYYYGPRYYGPRYYGPPLVSFRFGFGGYYHGHR